MRTRFRKNIGSFTTTSAPPLARAMAPSSSPSTATSIRSRRRPRVFARNDIASKKNPLAGLALFISTLTLLSCGTAADSSSTCLERTSSPAAEVPVRSPPGRARLATNFAPTGSPALIMTMGRPGAPSRAARMAAVPNARISATGSALSSAASSRWRCGFSPAQRISITRFFPSTQPRSRNAARSTSRRCRYPGTGAATKARNPILAGWPAGCARGPRASSSAAAEPTTKRLRSIIGLPRRSGKAVGLASARPRRGDKVPAVHAARNARPVQQRVDTRRQHLPMRRWCLCNRAWRPMVQPSATGWRSERQAT